MPIVVIHGRPATGKTRNAEAFRRQFGCSRIVDDWGPDNRQDLRPGDLVLTQERPAEIIRHLAGHPATIMAVDHARKAIRR